jgi:hypothetical protein
VVALVTAKNRGNAQSVESDWYATPSETTRAPLRELAAEISANCPGGKVRRIIEPTAGKGAIVRVLHEFFPDAEITACELDRTRFDMLRDLQLCQAVYHRDYADLPAPGEPFDLAILNPPFTIARSIVEKARLESTHTLSLLRLGFLSSADRRPFWRRHPADILPLSSRPKFAASLKCTGRKVPKGQPKEPSCGWALIQDIEAPRTKSCPQCTVGRVDVNTSDSADYMWAHMWAGARPVRVL